MSLLTTAWGSLRRDDPRDMRALQDCFVHYATNAEWRKYIFSRKWKDAWHKHWYRVYVMRSVAWKRKHGACLERAGNRCQVCRKAVAVQAHHLTYERLGDEADEDLQAVCVACHKHGHG